MDFHGEHVVSSCFLLLPALTLSILVIRRVCYSKSNDPPRNSLQSFPPSRPPAKRIIVVLALISLVLLSTLLASFGLARAVSGQDFSPSLSIGQVLAQVTLKLMLGLSILYALQGLPLLNSAHTLKLALIMFIPVSLILCATVLSLSLTLSMSLLFEAFVPALLNVAFSVSTIIVSILCVPVLAPLCFGRPCALSSDHRTAVAQHGYPLETPKPCDNQAPFSPINNSLSIRCHAPKRPPSFPYFPSPPSTPLPDSLLQEQESGLPMGLLLNPVHVSLLVAQFCFMLSGIFETCSAVFLGRAIYRHEYIPRSEHSTGMVFMAMEVISLVFSMVGVCRALFGYFSAETLSQAGSRSSVVSGGTSTNNVSMPSTQTDLSFGFTIPSSEIISPSSHYSTRSQRLRSSFPQYSHWTRKLAKENIDFAASKSRRSDIAFPAKCRQSVSAASRFSAVCNTEDGVRSHLYPSYGSNILDFHVLQVDAPKESSFLPPVAPTAKKTTTSQLNSFSNKINSVSLVPSLRICTGKTWSLDRLGRETSHTSTQVTEDFCTLQDPFAAPSQSPGVKHRAFNALSCVSDGVRGNRMSAWGALPNPLPPTVQHQYRVSGKRKRYRDLTATEYEKEISSDNIDIAVDVEEALLAQRLCNRLESIQNKISHDSSEDTFSKSSPSRRALKSLGINLPENLSFGAQRATSKSTKRRP